jgi:hypothetical protein
MTINGSNDDKSSRHSEISAELITKAAKLKEKTAKLKQRMEITQHEVSKALNSVDKSKSWK